MKAIHNFNALCFSMKLIQMGHWYLIFILYWCLQILSFAMNITLYGIWCIVIRDLLLQLIPSEVFAVVTALTIKDILKKAILVTRNSAMNVYYDNQFWSNQKLLISVHLETQFLCGTRIFVILNMEEKNLSYSRGQLSKLQYG